MTAYSFRPATRERVGLLIGIAGASGSGKTFSAMRLASGIAGNKPFAVIDTERRRALHYADQFRFDHCEIDAPFEPRQYADAIAAADAAKYPVIVVDSMSHEWAGEGGVLDMADAEFQRMGGRESAKMASWIKPKQAHKRMMTKLLQVNAHLILCFRAEPKIEMVKENGKTVVKPKESLIGLDGWIPVCEKNLPFELTSYFLMTSDRPGVPKPIKLQEQHKALFPTDRVLDESAGKRVAEWAAGGVVAPKSGRLPAALQAFSEIGVTIDDLESYLGHTPTEQDVPALKAYIDKLRADRAAGSSNNQEEPQE
jgi:hypothetical protein